MEKVVKLKRFFGRRRMIRPLFVPTTTESRSDTSTCSDANCSSYNFGLPLRICVRVCSIIGMISSLLYIIAGTSLITHISQTEQVGFSTFSAQESQTATTRNIYYKRNVGFFIGIAVILVILNSIQLISDLFLFLSTLKPKTCNSLWVYMVVDVTLWIMILICFITIFSGGGLFLLLVFLLGTAIRTYITFMLHEYMIEESKTLGNNVENQNKVETAPQPRHLISSPIPEESTIIEQYSVPESRNYYEEDERRQEKGGEATVQKEVTHA